MPELPEVETVRRGLAARLEGHELVRVRAHRPDLRVPLPKDLGRRLTGRKVRSITRRGKYLLFHFDRNIVLLAHLGMSGRMVIDGGGPLEPHDHVVFEADDGTKVKFNDQRRFGLLLLTTEAEWPRHPLIRRMGPEPLEPSFTGQSLSAALVGKRTPIKSALIDQRIVAGLGNIYACESLYRAGISPLRLARDATGKRANRLAAAIREVLEEAIAAGGSSLRNHRLPSGDLGAFQHRWAVYGREGKACSYCAARGRRSTIRRITQAGRSTFYCPRCQR